MTRIYIGAYIAIQGEMKEMTLSQSYCDACGRRRHDEKFCPQCGKPTLVEYKAYEILDTSASRYGYLEDQLQYFTSADNVVYVIPESWYHNNAGALMEEEIESDFYADRHEFDKQILEEQIAKFEARFVDSIEMMKKMGTLFEIKSGVLFT